MADNGWWWDLLNGDCPMVIWHMENGWTWPIHKWFSNLFLAVEPHSWVSCIAPFFWWAKSERVSMKESRPANLHIPGSQEFDTNTNNLTTDWWLVASTHRKHSCHLVQPIFALCSRNRVFPTHYRWTLFERLVLSSPCRNLGEGYLVTVHAVEAFPSLSSAAPCGVILTPRKLELWEFAFHLSMWAKPVPSGKNRLWLAT